MAVSMPKGTTVMGMEGNRNSGKWLSYGRGISGTSGQHHIQTVNLLYL